MSERKPYYFWRNKHPFNDYMSARIAEDKAFQYDLLSKADVPIPHTKQIFNPLADCPVGETGCLPPADLPSPPP